MASPQDFNKRYNQAFVAYGQGQYKEAEEMLAHLASDYPDNPQICLLQAHLYYITEQYPLAYPSYERAIALAPGHPQAEELINCAQEGIERTQELLSHQTEKTLEDQDFSVLDSSDLFEQRLQKDDFSPTQVSELAVPFSPGAPGSGFQRNQSDDPLTWHSSIFQNEAAEGDPTLGQRHGFEPEPGEPENLSSEFTTGRETGLDLPSTLDEASPVTFPLAAPENPGLVPTLESEESTFGWSPELDETSPDTFAFAPSENSSSNEAFEDGEATFGWSSPLNDAAPETFALSPAQEDVFFGSSGLGEPPLIASAQGKLPSSLVSPDPDWAKKTVPGLSSWAVNGNSDPRELFQGTPTAALDPSPWVAPVSNQSVFEELDPISVPDLSEIAQGGLDSAFFSPSDQEMNTGLDGAIAPSFKTGSLSAGVGLEALETPKSAIAPVVEVKQGVFAGFQNASLDRKKWYLAACTGAGSALAVLLMGGLWAVMTPQTPPSLDSSAGKKMTVAQKSSPAKAQTPTSSAPALGGILLMALVSGLAGFGVSLFLSHLALSQTKRSLQALTEQFEAIRQGNFNVRATVLSGDEVGALNANFNNLSITLFSQVQNALQRAEEMEQARDNLQRQVIRLLDNVEGAARGDLTVEAEVTADVLGTVADAFNLTIKNLRDIVSQVKKAAQQVNKGSTDSESFARKNSNDAKSMAEEVAVTLNSIHLMSESVQRVAQNAKEAEEVALSSSKTALKGGEAVERTVAGILQIRETVSETARKVKRLAEASQEISKIVALISQVASRTNLLALNASIQAARAGEAGRGFAVVAGEVRQLADRSAKSLKEIEQIVLQIQGETGSVMTAMEEGIQQVIDVTDKSEQAKRSLEDIISVSNHINTLVRSISSDTVKQQETALSVAQVMQWVDRTAQGTAQESQQVAGSLQNLVAISRELLSSVERFRVEQKGKK